MNLHLTAFRSAKDNLKTGNFVFTLDLSENFPEHVTGILFSYSLTKLRQNFRKFSYFLVNL